MTDTQSLWLFILVGAFILAYLADTYTTMIGLQHGFKEWNPLSRFLIGKLGISLNAFLTGSVVIFGVGLSSKWIGADSLILAGGLAAGEAVMALRNYLMLRKAKISLR